MHRSVWHSHGRHERLNENETTTAKLKNLVEHIVAGYHEPLRQELERVAHLVEKVARVHGDNHPEMVQVKDTFNRFKAQLELHMQKEEMVLFPGIVSMETTGSPQIFGCGGGIEHPIDVMSQEHDEAGEALCTMRQLTNNYTPPEDACSSSVALLSSANRIGNAPACSQGKQHTVSARPCASETCGILPIRH